MLDEFFYGSGKVIPPTPSGGLTRSLRFNSVDSSYLQQISSSGGNRKTWTWSGWVKRSALGIIKSGVFGVEGTNAMIRFNNDNGGDQLRVLDNASGGYDLITAAVFRDTSSWYHFVVALDTTQSTASDRLKLYVNGVQITEFVTATYPSQNQDLTFNTTSDYRIGVTGTGNEYFDGYLAQIHFIDGQALDPTRFGQFDSNGVWQEITYTGTYGTNGFYLEFNNNSSVAALGTDTSGNGNNFTVHNLSRLVSLNETAQQNFDAVTYTGTASTQSISSLAFQPDFVWLKRRNGVGNNNIQDTVRGAEAVIQSDSDRTEFTNSPRVSSFDSNGFTLTSDNGGNASGGTYVAWCWNAGANSNKTYTVKVVSDNGNKYRFDNFGTSAVTLDLAEGSTYIFDQSDSSNTGHPIGFGTSSNGTDYTTGVTHTGTPGSAGAKTTLVLASPAPPLYYSCLNHSGMGGQINTNSTVGASNFDGSIQTTVKANVDYGFSIAKFTQPSTVSSFNWGHGLSEAPKFVIIKPTSLEGNWQVYHSVAGSAYLQLNNNNIAIGTGWGTIDNSVVTATATLWGGSSVETIAYMWSEVAGFSKFGSFTGASTVTVTTGFKPEYILIKNTTTLGSWSIFDAARDPDGQIDYRLYANETSEELTGIIGNFTDTGFILTNQGNSNWNTTGDTFVYAAFAATIPPPPGGDSLFDSPINGTQTDKGLGGEISGNYCVLNPLFNSTGTYTEGNLQLLTTAGNRHYQATFGLTSGKWYWEIEPDSGTTPGMVGIALGNKPTTENLNGAGAMCYYGVTGNKQGGNSSAGGDIAYGATFTYGDIIGVALDLDSSTKTLTFYKNGVSQGVAFNPDVSLGAWFPAVSSGSAVNTTTFIANFGQRPFVHPISGYKCLNSASLPEPTIPDGSEYFDTKLWTGNGSTQVIDGFAYSPDLAWIKSRSNIWFNELYDTVRGVDKVIYSNDTMGENSSGTRGLADFTNNGFEVTTANGQFGTNTETDTYVGWAWDSGTSTVTNNDGSLTSQVRANPSAGFSIVKWTGNRSAATVGHGLNAAVKFYFVKNLAQSTNWLTWHTELPGGGTGYIRLNTDGAAGIASSPWNSTVPTNSVFSLGVDTESNGDGVEMVAYCFAPVEGYSAFGSYIGNGYADDGPFVFLGFKPAVILYKRIDSTGYWRLMDSKRDPNNVAYKILFPNTDDVESTTQGNNQYDVDFLSNGFKIRTSLASSNASGGTFIYYAVAENPFQANGGLAR